MEPSSAAFDNYCAYLSPAIERWGVVFDSTYHSAIVRGLLARLDHVTLLDLRAGPQPVAAFAREHLHDDRVGAMEFLLNQPTFDVGYSPELERAIGEFDRWGTYKVKICFEVWDGNFASLFSEDSQELRARCLEMHARIRDQPGFSYGAPPGGTGRLDIECRDAVWITQTGFEHHDYLLPTGEVATCPSSLDGTASLGGWIIGTVPFGAKYGHLSPGEITLRFARGEVAEVSGSNARLCADLELVLAKFPTLRQVSEAAVGMSRAIAGAARTHTAGHFWHERHIGFHIGLGARLPLTPHPDLADLAPIGPHLDLVFEHGALRAADGSALLAW
jgi:hypothetical protein